MMAMGVSLRRFPGIVRLGLVVLALAALAPARAQAAPVNALSSLSATAWGKPSSSDQWVGTVGWQFHVETTFEISHLGWFDRAGDGLEADHEIAIWALDHSILATGVVLAGTASPLDDLFRWVEITPIELQAGQDYIVAGTEHLDWYTSVATYDLAPQVSYMGNRGGWGTVAGPIMLHWPNQFNLAGGEGYWGPNFRIVPEPISAVLLAVGGLAVLKRRRTSHRV